MPRTPKINDRLAGSGKKKPVAAAKSAAKSKKTILPDEIITTGDHIKPEVHLPEGEKIVFRGVKTHNLRDIDVTIPKNKIVSVVGVSGSGKSSFAFDTVYKEGQYRYIESLSSYLRQFFNLGERPDIDYTE